MRSKGTGLKDFPNFSELDESRPDPNGTKLSPFHVSTASSTVAIDFFISSLMEPTHLGEIDD